MKRPEDVLLAEILNPGGRGGQEADIDGPWTQESAFRTIEIALLRKAKESRKDKEWTT